MPFKGVPWEAFEELAEHLSNEMIWQNCRFHVLDFWLEKYYNRLGDDLLLWAYLHALETIGVDLEFWEEFCEGGDDV